MYCPYTYPRGSLKPRDANPVPNSSLANDLATVPAFGLRLTVLHDYPGADPGFLMGGGGGSKIKRAP